MSITLASLLEESIILELKAGELYRLYSQLFPDDRDFWIRLSLEEMNHAALLKSARQFLNIGKLPPEALYRNIDTLREINSRISQRIEQYRDVRPDECQAYAFAQELEMSAAEKHFQQIMESAGDERIFEIFRKLAGSDRDHAERIKGMISCKHTKGSN